MAFRVKFDGKQIGRQARLVEGEMTRKVQTAVRQGLKDAADEIVRRGRVDIAQAGNFGPRWQKGLRATIDNKPNQESITVTHDIPYWRVHQFGATIHGRPLLWIPLSFSDAVGTRARDYPEPLFMVERKGKSPLLLSATSGEPKYSGHESVRIPKRFHLLEIARDVGSRIKQFIKERMKKNG